MLPHHGPPWASVPAPAAPRTCSRPCGRPAACAALSQLVPAGLSSVQTPVLTASSSGLSVCPAHMRGALRRRRAEDFRARAWTWAAWGPGRDCPSEPHAGTRPRQLHGTPGWPGRVAKPAGATVLCQLRRAPWRFLRNQGPTWKTPRVCRGPLSGPGHRTGGRMTATMAPRSRRWESQPRRHGEGPPRPGRAAPARKPGPCLAGDQQDGARGTPTSCPGTFPRCAWHLTAEAASEGRRSYAAHMGNGREGARGLRLFVLIAEDPAGSDGNSAFCAHRGSFFLGLTSILGCRTRRPGEPVVISI